jgi:hypothetical protein
LLERIRNKFFDKFREKYDINALKYFKDYYNRSFSNLCSKQIDYNVKYRELHIKKDSLRLEFRGFHLLYADTWEDMFWRIDTFIKTIKEEIIIELGKEKSFEDKTEIKEKFVFKYRPLLKESFKLY